MYCHLEGTVYMYSFEVFLSDCPCLCSIQKYRHHHHHSEHANLGLLTHSSTSHLTPLHVVHCGCIPSPGMCAHLHLLSSSPHFTPQVGEYFHSHQLKALQCDCWLITVGHLCSDTHSYGLRIYGRLCTIPGKITRAFPPSYHTCLILK